MEHSTPNRLVSSQNKERQSDQFEKQVGRIISNVWNTAPAYKLISKCISYELIGGKKTKKEKENEKGRSLIIVQYICSTNPVNEEGKEDIVSSMCMTKLACVSLATCDGSSTGAGGTTVSVRG